jgi:hypothetical protein
MLVVYLFNLNGYGVFFKYYINQSNQQITQQANNSQYSDSELTEIKIKLNLPYMTDWSSYERYDGEVELNGIHYNYVKRKISQDTLYILCLANEIKTQLCKEKIDYATRVNDIPAGKENNNSTFKKGVLLNEFKQQPLHFDFAIAITGVHTELFYIHTHLPDTYIQCNGEPPESNT